MVNFLEMSLTHLTQSQYLAFQQGNKVKGSEKMSPSSLMFQRTIVNVLEDYLGVDR